MQRGPLCIDGCTKGSESGSPLRAHACINCECEGAMGTPIHAAQCMQISPTKCKSQTGARQIAQRVLVKFPHLLMRGRIAHFSCPPPPKTKSRASSISLTKSPYSAVLIRSTSWATNCIAKHVQCLYASSIIMVRCPTTSAISFC